MLDRRSLNRFLQANGFCFPSHLAEAFFRRFNFEGEDVLSQEHFAKVLLEVGAR